MVSKSCKCRRADVHWPSVLRGSLKLMNQCLPRFIAAFLLPLTVTVNSLETKSGSFPPVVASSATACRSSRMKTTRFVRSSGRPPSSTSAGNSQSKSKPSKPCLRTHWINEVIKTARRLACDTMFEKRYFVPGSFKNNEKMGRGEAQSQGAAMKKKRSRTQECYHGRAVL